MASSTSVGMKALIWTTQVSEGIRTTRQVRGLTLTIRRRGVTTLGFFSVQVLDRCLEVWNLSLTRWRAEEMASE